MPHLAYLQEARRLLRNGPQQRALREKLADEVPKKQKGHLCRQPFFFTPSKQPGWWVLRAGGVDLGARPPASSNRSPGGPEALWSDLGGGMGTHPSLG